MHLRRVASGGFSTSCNINDLVYIVWYERAQAEEMIRQAAVVLDRAAKGESS